MLNLSNNKAFLFTAISLIISVFLASCSAFDSRDSGESGYGDTVSPSSLDSEETQANVQGEADAPLDPTIPQEAYDIQNVIVASLNAKRYDEAVGLAEKAIDEYPNYAGFYLNKGIALANLDKNEDAFEAFNDAIQLNDKLQVAYNQIGITERKRGNFESARQWYQKAIDIDSNYAAAHLNLGILCDLYLQDEYCALQHYQAYEDLNVETSKQFDSWKIDLERRIKRKNSG